VSPARVTRWRNQVTDGAMATLIDEYAREAGVRNLKKHLEKMYRKAALKLVQVTGDGKQLYGSFSCLGFCFGGAGGHEKLCRQAALR
jgi:ATP-dependent Lon protease